MSYQYKHVACGGTFDLLHRGHREFLKFAFSKAAKVSIGITTDQMAKKNGKNSIQSLKIRLVELKKFLNRKKYLGRSKVIFLNDVFGSTLVDKTIQGLLITSQTHKGGLVINQKRKGLGLGLLPMIRSPMILATDERPISTTRIRLGVIDREGFSFYKFLVSKSKFVLPEKLRQKLSKPQGDLVTNILKILNDVKREYDTSLLITVGDETTVAFLKAGIVPNLAIVDFKVGRNKKYHKITHLGFSDNVRVITVRNKAGTISRSLVKAINGFFRRKTEHLVIKIIGEEDLAVLPVVLLAPLESVVCYGQRGQGVVLVKVTEQKKSEFLKILRNFN